MRRDLIDAARGDAPARAARFTYNLFRRREEPDLFCAVPEHAPVPRFIGGDAWDFGGRLAEAGAAPRGFDPRAARDGVRRSGYYVFMAALGAGSDASRPGR